MKMLKPSQGSEVQAEDPVKQALNTTGTHALYHQHQEHNRRGVAIALYLARTEPSFDSKLVRQEMTRHSSCVLELTKGERNGHTGL